MRAIATTRTRCTVCEIHRNIELIRESSHAAAMIAMLMSNENRVNLNGIYAETSQSAQRFSQREAAIKRDREVARMRSPKVTNVMARSSVQERTSFLGNNLFGQWTHNDAQPYSKYVVYSYGYHWPLFIYERGVWYENIDKHSVTTSKHRTQTHPLVDTVAMTLEDMLTIRDHGVAGVAIGIN